MASMKLIDGVGWQLLRLSGLLQSIAGELLLLVYKPVPYQDAKRYQWMTSLYMSGLLLFQSKTSDDFPDTIRPQLILAGRISIAVVVFIFVDQILDVIRLSL